MKAIPPQWVISLIPDISQLASLHRFGILPQTSYLCIMEEQERQRIEEDIVKMLKTVYDPEIPVDVYNLGLIYGIVVEDDGTVKIDMTLTAPTCPASDFLFEDINMKVSSINGVKAVETNLVFEPEWDRDMMSEEAKLELGLL